MRRGRGANRAGGATRATRLPGKIARSRGRQRAARIDRNRRATLVLRRFEKGKPVARRGRKVTGPRASASGTAGLPRRGRVAGKPAAIPIPSAAFRSPCFGSGHLPGRAAARFGATERGVHENHNQADCSGLRARRMVLGRARAGLGHARGLASGRVQAFFTRPARGRERSARAWPQRRRARRSPRWRAEPSARRAGPAAYCRRAAPHFQHSVNCPSSRSPQCGQLHASARCRRAASPVKNATSSAAARS